MCIFDAFASADSMPRRQSLGSCRRSCTMCCPHPAAAARQLLGAISRSGQQAQGLGHDPEPAGR
eukprot:scaffold32164_cov20-Tisochrysis_lutea.AAC.1